jgi:hypothetical protein
MILKLIFKNIKMEKPDQIELIKKLVHEELDVIFTEMIRNKIDEIITEKVKYELESEYGAKILEIVKAAFVENENENEKES